MSRSEAKFLVSKLNYEFDELKIYFGGEMSCKNDINVQNIADLGLEKFKKNLRYCPTCLSKNELWI